MSAANSFRLAVRGQCRIGTRTYTARSIGRRRHFATTSSRWTDEPPKPFDPDEKFSYPTSVDGQRVLTSHEMLHRAMERVTGTKSDFIDPNDWEGLEEAMEQHKGPKFTIDNMIDPDETLEEAERVDRAALDADPSKVDFRDPNLFNRGPKQKAGFMNLGVKNADDPMEDPEFEENDISALAHGELEQHREFREYARLAAWEMPLLTKMAKPFVPPTQKQVLRFRYTTYMGEQHPAEKKVVVEFCPADIPGLTSIQMDKLKKLAGVRWNPETDIIKMSSEMFESQAQNKRYLGDLVDVLVTEAKDPKDTFEDVPLDTRHHPIKVKPKFPIEWRMTEQRRAQLEIQRQEALEADEQRAIQGAIVDGVQYIEDTYAAAKRLKKEQARLNPVMAAAPAESAKSRRLSVRR